jgi:hypothetical protein
VAELQGDSLDFRQLPDLLINLLMFLGKFQEIFRTLAVIFLETVPFVFQRGLLKTGFVEMVVAKVGGQDPYPGSKRPGGVELEFWYSRTISP